MSNARITYKHIQKQTIIIVNTTKNVAAWHRRFLRF